MKYILKIFLIVLLVVAIIGAACWFFLVQRPDLTMSVFAHWGDYFYDAGRYNRAVSLYETALQTLAGECEPARPAGAGVYQQRQLHEGRVHPRQRHHE